MAAAVETGSVATAVQDDAGGVTSYTVSTFSMPSVTDAGLLAVVRVCYGLAGAVSDVTGVTWNGVSMVEEKEQLGDTFNKIGIWIFSLLSPATGTNDLVVSLASTNNRSISVTFVPMSGVNQTDLCGAGDGAQATSGTSQSDSYTTTAANSLIVGGIVGHGDDQDPYTPKTDNTEIDDGSTAGGTVNGHSYWAGYMTAASAGAYTFGADSTVNDGWCIAEIEVFEAAGAGGGSTFRGLSLLGVGT